MLVVCFVLFVGACFFVLDCCLTVGVTCLSGVPWFMLFWGCCGLLLAVVRWLLLVACWLLVVGCWLVVVGYCLLVVGCYVSVVGNWLLFVARILWRTACWLLLFVGCLLLVVFPNWFCLWLVDCCLEFVVGFGCLFGLRCLLFLGC